MFTPGGKILTSRGGIRTKSNSNEIKRQITLD